MWNIEISKWEGREEWPFTGLFLDVSCHRKTFWSGQNISFLQFRYFTFPYIFRLGSLFGSIFQSRTRIIKNYDDFHSTRGTVAAVVLLSNFEANRSSNENSRVGSPDLVRELKSGTGIEGTRTEQGLNHRLICVYCETHLPHRLATYNHDMSCSCKVWQLVCTDPELKSHSCFTRQRFRLWFSSQWASCATRNLLQHSWTSSFENKSITHV